MNLVLAADNNFAAPLAVTLKSIEETTSHPEHLNIYVIDCGISDEARARVERSVPTLTLTFVDISDVSFHNLVEYGHLSKATYGRLFVGSLLPREVSRVIYLDCDLVVRCDVSELWSLAGDLQGHAVGAVRDSGVPVVGHGIGCWRQLEIPPSTPLFNSGVLLIDLDLWRDQQIADRCLEVLSVHRDSILWADQDALNAVIRGDFQSIPLRWNSMQGMRTGRDMPYTFAELEEVENAITDPAIIHFTGAVKPWHRGCHDPARDQWRDIYNRTAFPRLRPRYRNVRHMLVHIGTVVYKVITK